MQNVRFSEPPQPQPLQASASQLRLWYVKDSEGGASRTMGTSVLHGFIVHKWPWETEMTLAKPLLSQCFQF